MEPETQAGGQHQGPRVQVIIALIGAASTVIVALIGLLTVVIDPTPETGPAVIVVAPTAAPLATPAPTGAPITTAGAAPGGATAAPAAAAPAAPAPAGAFPCDATVSAWNAGELNVVRDFPEQSALLREPIKVNTAVRVLDISGTMPPWYRIASPEGRVLGWIPAEYLSLAATCPRS